MVETKSRWLQAIPDEPATTSAPGAQWPGRTQMSTRIAIIGAGNVGRALATSATRAGYQVTVSSRNPKGASQIANADIVILAVPFTALETLSAELSDVLAGKIVVDVSNRSTQAGPSIAETL